MNAVMDRRMIFLVGTDTLEVFMVLLLLLFYSLYSRGCSVQQQVHKMTLWWC